MKGVKGVPRLRDCEGELVDCSRLGVSWREAADWCLMEED